MKPPAPAFIIWTFGSFDDDVCDGDGALDIVDTEDNAPMVLGVGEGPYASEVTDSSTLT